MAKCEDLLAEARNNQRGVRFNDLLKLAECWGFTLARQRGSHRIFKREGFRNFLNFQPDHNGMAKAPQVRELLDAIDELSNS